jgi:hypothetical protein
VFLFGDEFGPHRPALQDQLTGDLKRISSIPHHGDRLLIPAEIRPDIRAALAAGRILRIRCGLFFGFFGAELASSHFEAGQKLDIALIAADVGFADARVLLRCAKLRPAFGQLILGSGFVFRAVPGRLDGSYDFFATVLCDVERRRFFGGSDSINRKSRDNGGKSKNAGTHSDPPSNVPAGLALVENSQVHTINLMTNF